MNNDYFNWHDAEYVIVNRLPGEKMGPKVFFQIHEDINNIDDLEIKLSRFHLTMKDDIERIEKEMEECEGKVYILNKQNKYELYIYSHGRWLMIGAYA